MNCETSKNYEDYLVAFIDILGFSSLIHNSERDDEDFNKIKFALIEFSKLQEKSTWEENKILIEVEECAQKKNLDDYYIENMVRCFCFSDSIIITVKANDHINERTSALIAMLSKIGAYLLAKGILIRGAIDFGKMYVDDDRKSSIVFGPSIIDAYELEKEQAKYPRIILSSNLIDKLNYPITMRNQSQPYHQYITRFEDGLVGFTQLIFLQEMENAPDVISNNDYCILLENIKSRIINGLDKNMTDSHVLEKYNWLKNEFNHLSIEFPINKKISQIFDVSLADSRGNIHYSYINNFY